MKRVAVLVSGGGTNLQALLESERRGENPDGKITLVIASKPGVYALERAANFGVESAVVSRKNYASSADFDTALLGVLQAHDIDVVVLAGFLSVLGEKVIAAYRNRILNEGSRGCAGPRRQADRCHRPSCQRGMRWRADPAAEGCGCTARRHPRDFAEARHGRGRVAAIAQGIGDGVQ